MIRVLSTFLAFCSLSSGAAAPTITYPDVKPGYQLQFPQDEGSHPDFRTEWWYVTGWLKAGDGRERGFQITFFRARPESVAQDNPSTFAPKQILFAHVALSDPAEKKLLHAQRIARAGLGLAEAKTGLTHVWINDWSLQQQGSRYLANIATPEFRFEFAFDAGRPPMLNGDRGYSQKSPNPLAASYYYSIPHLEVSGTLTQRGKPQNVTGTAWLDHEWSSEYIDARAVGWDWTGINFDDGGALMAFRMRDKTGKALWASGTYRRGDGSTRALHSEEITFSPIKNWRSPRSGADYPISVRIRAGDEEWVLAPLLDDQELDSSDTTRAIYWEGAVHVLKDGKRVGRGYLELTGYAKALNF